MEVNDLSAFWRSSYIQRMSLRLQYPKILPNSVTGVQKHRSKFLLVTIETDRGEWDRDGYEIAKHILYRRANGTNTRGMFFPVESNTFVADTQQLLEQTLTRGNGVWCKGREVLRHEVLDLLEGHFSQEGLAVRSAIERKRRSHCRDGLKAVWGRDLIDEQDPVSVQHGKVDGLIDFFGKPLQVRMKLVTQLHVHCSRQRCKTWTKADTTVLRGRGHEAFGLECAHDTMDG